MRDQQGRHRSADADKDADEDEVEDADEVAPFWPKAHWSLPR